MKKNNPDHTTFKCKACSEIKSISEFYKSTTTLRGHDSTCKVCREDNKRARIAKRKKWQHKEVYDDNVNAARNASTYDLSIAQLVKIGDERRFKEGVKRIKKAGIIKDIFVVRDAYSRKDGLCSVIADIRADGVLFKYESDYFESKAIAEKHLNFIRENAGEIIKQKLKEVA